MQHVCCYNLYSFLLYDKTKRAPGIAEALFGIIHLRKQSARSRDRTGTGVTPLVFETNASTNSAIRAVDISFLRQTECKGNERPRNVQYLDYTFVLTCYWLGSYFFFSLHSDMESPPRVFFSAQKGRRKSGCLDSYFFSGRNLSPFCPKLFYFSGRNEVQFQARTEFISPCTLLSFFLGSLSR